MTVTATDLQNLIINSLSDADPTARTGLQAYVPAYWALWARQGVLPELQYWYTRRDAVRYLMAGVTRQVDYFHRSQNATRAGASNTRHDSSMTASATETASSLADRSSSSQYDDATDSSGSGSSTSNRSSSQTADHTASMTDIGSGSNSSLQTSSLSATSSVSGAANDATSTTANLYRHLGGAHTTTSGFDKVGGQIFLGAGGGSTDTTNTGSTSGTITDDTSGTRSSTYTAYHSEHRANNSSETTARPLASNFSNFTANMHSSDSAVADGSGSASSHSVSSFTMSGSGTGSMTATGTGGSTMTGDISRTSHADGEAHHTRDARSQMTSTLEKLHQRFVHLQEMWARANDMIEWFEKQRLSLSPYLFQAMTLQYPEGLNADAANLYIARTPLGTRMLQ